MVEDDASSASSSTARDDRLKKGARPSVASLMGRRCGPARCLWSPARGQQHRPRPRTTSRGRGTCMGPPCRTKVCQSSCGRTTKARAAAASQREHEGDGLSSPRKATHLELVWRHEVRRASGLALAVEAKIDEEEHHVLAHHGLSTTDRGTRTLQCRHAAGQREGRAREVATWQ